MNFGIASVASITALCYLLGIIIGAFEDEKLKLKKYIPAACGIVGLCLGVCALWLGVPDFPATDILSAAAVGAVSGLAATGLDQVTKQLHK